MGTTMPKGGKTIAHILPFVLRPMLPPSDPLFPPLELEVDELVVVGRVLVGLAALVAEAACKKKSLGSAMRRLQVGIYVVCVRAISR